MTPLIFVALMAAHDAQAQAQAVEKALVAAEPKLHRCWEQAATDDFRVEGQISVAVTVGDKGKAGKVAVKADSIGQKPLESCVAGAFDDVTFGDAFAPGDSVEVPVTFKAESNVTVKAGDAKSNKLNGAQGVAKILIDDKTAKADKASLVWIDLQPSARYVRPSPKGMAFIYVRRGRAVFGGQSANEDEVVVLPDGASPLIQASNRTELVILFVPPGAEQAYRTGAKIPEPTVGGPAPKVIATNAAEKHDILGGKGIVWIYVENDQAAVDHLRFEAGAVVPEHTHDGSAELLYFTTGKGELTIDGEKFPVEPFTAAYVPPGAKHSFVAGDRRVEAIQFYTPSGPEQRFKGGK
jgi:quercetin dioxygenase-like cupin family protein